MRLASVLGMFCLLAVYSQVACVPVPPSGSSLNEAGKEDVIPMIVVIDGKSSCKSLAFDQRYLSPFDGRMWGSQYYQELYATTGSRGHGSNMVSPILNDIYPQKVHEIFWKGNSGHWDYSQIFACHSGSTTKDRQELVWWSDRYNRSYDTIFEESDANKKYAHMGYDWMYVKSNDPGDSNFDPYKDPVSGHTYRTGPSGYNRFLDLIQKTARNNNYGYEGKVPVYVVGYSLGGYLATRIAADLDHSQFALMSLVTIDPISPRTCPAYKLDADAWVDDAWDGGVGQSFGKRLAGCTGFPAELGPYSFKARQIIDRNSAEMGLSNRRAFINYYSNFFALKSGHNRHAHVNVQLSYWGNGHVAIVKDDSIWKWDPTEGVDDSWLAYRIRADGLHLKSGYPSFDRWKKSDYVTPSVARPGFALDGNARYEASPLTSSMLDKSKAELEAEMPLICDDKGLEQLDLRDESSESLAQLDGRVCTLIDGQVGISDEQDDPKVKLVGTTGEDLFLVVDKTDRQSARPGYKNEANSGKNTAGSDTGDVMGVPSDEEKSAHP